MKQRIMETLGEIIHSLCELRKAELFADIVDVIRDYAACIGAQCLSCRVARAAKSRLVKKLFDMGQKLWISYEKKLKYFCCSFFF